MPRRDILDNLPEDRRKEIFQALVEAQDRRLSVAQSRQVVSEQFGVTKRQLEAIEEQGIDLQWPPL